MRIMEGSGAQCFRHRASRRLPKLRKPLPAPEALPVGDAPPADAAGGAALEQLGLAVRKPDIDMPVNVSWRRHVETVQNPAATCRPLEQID